MIVKMSSEFEVLNGFFEMSFPIIENSNLNIVIEKNDLSEKAKQVDNLFQNVLNELEVICIGYVQQLKILLGGSLENPSIVSYEQIITKVTTQSKYVWLVLKLLKKENGPKISFLSNPPLKTSPLYFLGKYQAIVILRKYSENGVLPLTAIATASRFPVKEMKEGYFEQLEKWVNQIKSQITVNSFYKGLKSVCDIINEQRSSLEKEASFLILIKNVTLIWDVFLQVNPVHLSKMERFIAKPFVHQEEELQIGKKFFTDRHSSNFYEVINHPEYTFWIPPNRVFLALTFEDYQREIEGIKPARFIRSFDVKGRFAVVEKLEVFQLQQDQSPQALQDNADKIQLLINYIKSFLTSKTKHSDLIGLENLGVNQQSELRVYVRPKNSYLTFLKLEKIVFDFANSSLEIYKAIVDGSQLGKKQKIFFKDVLQKALVDAPWFSSATELALYGMCIDAEVIERGKAFFKIVQEFKIMLLASLNDRYEISDAEQFQKSFAKIVCRLYEKSSCIGRLWPTFDNLVEQEIISALKLRLLSPSTPVKFKSKRPPMDFQVDNDSD